MKKVKSIVLCVFTAGLLTFLFGCAQPASVTLDKESATIAVGETVPLTATVTPADAINTAVTWDSSDDGVAAVTADGLVTGIAEGTATVTVTTTEGGLTDTCEVTVSNALIPVTGVSLNKDAIGLVMEDTAQLSATIEPENATNRDVLWSSSDTGVAMVSDAGVVTAVGLGRATITATTEYGGFTAECAVLVPRLNASDVAAGDNFGVSVSISGDYACIGADYNEDNYTNSGSAYIFYSDQGGGDNWGQVKKLTASDAAEYDYFGNSVSISGDYACVGAYMDGDGDYYGSAYIFYRDQGGSDNWGQVKKLTASVPVAGDYFGISVSISGDYACVGAVGDDGTVADSGSAYIFYRNQGGADNWGQVIKLMASDGADGDDFGSSVSLSGDYACIGACEDDDAGVASGSAYIFYRNQGGIDNWGQVKKLTASDTAAGDYFGISVSLSGDYACVGAMQDTDSDIDKCGSAYIFYCDLGAPDNWGQVKKLTASDKSALDLFGYSVSISGDYACVGSYLDDDDEIDSGSAYIFSRDQGGTNNWGQVKKLTASDAAAADGFGYSVSIAGDYACVGAYQDDDDGTDSGSAYLFAVE